MSVPSGNSTAPQTSPDVPEVWIDVEETMIPSDAEKRKDFVRDQLKAVIENTKNRDSYSEDKIGEFIKALRFSMPNNPDTEEDLNRIVQELVNNEDEFKEFYGYFLGLGFLYSEDELADFAKPPALWQSTPSTAMNAQGDSSLQNKAVDADPVYLFNGNFVYSTSDFQIDGGGINFDFTRVYAQLSVFAGPLGIKWDHRYNLWIRFTEDYSKAFVSTGELRLDTYQRHEIFEYWIPPHGATGVLLEQGGKYIIKMPDGIIITYKPHPVLSPQVHIVDRIEDRFGNYLQFYYEEGLLSRTEINRPDRAVNFFYDSESRIKEIQDFTGRKWRYFYDDWGDLAAVTAPATADYKKGLTTCYEYSSPSITEPRGQHNLISIIDADGQIYLENEYGIEKNLLSYNRVIRQRQGNGETFFEYADVVEHFDIPYQSNEKPAYQTIVTERDGRQARYLFNRFGNMIFKEEYARINGIPKLVAHHFRYNKDGNLVGVISPLGVITQYLYGRDYFEKRYPPNEDYRYDADSKLTPKVRQGFHKLLSTVKRKGYYSINSLNLSMGLWSSDIFPDIYNTNEEDIIQKIAYEPDYFQMLSASDPRFTASADPDYVESEHYHKHLTRYNYKSQQGLSNFLLHSVELPQPVLPDGTLSEKIITTFADYDAKGRLLKSVTSSGMVTENTYYSQSDGLLEGFLKTTAIDPTGLGIKTGTERDRLGRITKTFSPKYYEFNDHRFFSINEYNELNHIIKTTSGAPVSVNTFNIYNRTGNLFKSKTELKNSDHVLTGYFETIHKYDEEFHLLSNVSGDIETGQLKIAKSVFDRAGRPYIAIAPSGLISKIRYNERGLTWYTISDYGGVNTTTKQYYDADGRLVKTIDPLGNVSYFHYDTQGRPVDTEDAKGNRLIKHFDKAGNLLVELFFEKTKENEFQLLSRKSFNYDAAGRQYAVNINKFKGSPKVTEVELLKSFITEGPGDLLTYQFFYNRIGKFYKRIDPSGKVFLTDYDVAGRVIKQTDPAGNETIYQYDSENNVIRKDRKEITRNSNSNEIIYTAWFAETYSYDELNRLIEKTNSLGNKTQYRYDSRNNPVKQIDALGNALENRYDLFSRLMQITRYLHQYHPGEVKEPVNTIFTYNKFDLIIEQEDALGRITRFNYDSSGRRVSSILPDGSSDLVKYNRSGKVIFYQDRIGLNKVFQYDALNRNTEIQILSEGLMPDIEIYGATNIKMQYDGAGKITAIENDHVTTQFVHNSLGWNTEEKNIFKPAAGLVFPPTVSLKRQFNDKGVQTFITYPSGRTIKFERDTLERIAAIKQTEKGSNYPGNSNTPEKFPIATFEYDGLRRKKIARGNNTSTRYQYDFGARLVAINHLHLQNSFLHLQLFYDALGNMQQQTEAAAAYQKTQYYKYDSLSRIIDTQENNSAIIKNLNPIAPPATPIPAAIPDKQAQINAMISGGNFPSKRGYQYDKAGNRDRTLTDGVENIYDTNELDQYENINDRVYRYHKNGNLAEDADFIYTYNHQNQLSKIKTKTDGSETVFIYDALGRKCARIEGGLTETMVYDGHNLIEEYANGVLKASMVSDTGQDNLLLCSKENKEFYYYPDLTKSVRFVFDGNVPFNHYQYDEFGNITGSPNINDGNPFRFGGKRFLSKYNKYDFVFRTYDPVTGKFMQRDPKGFVDGTNLYLYVGNNPLTHTDSFGTQSRDEGNHSSNSQQLPQDTGGFWGKNWDHPLVTTLTNDVYGAIFDILGQASKSMPNFSVGEKFLREVNVPGVDTYFGNHFIKRSPYTYFEYSANRNFLNRAISFSQNKFPSFLKGLKFLAPLDFFSSLKGLDDAINSNKNIPEKGADIAASSASLYSSLIATAELFGVNTTVLSGGATIAGTPIIASTALLAGAFAGGYAFGQWFDKKTGWHHSTANRGLKVEQAVKDITKDIPILEHTGDVFASVLGGFASIPFLSETSFGALDPMLETLYSDDDEVLSILPPN